MTALADELAKGAGRFLKWGDTPGAAFTGTILSADLRQATKFGTTEPDTWDNGDPKMQAVITLSTDQRDPADPDDDGTRRVAVNLWSGQKQALIKACRDAGVKEPAAGMRFTATWRSGIGTAASPRVFEYHLEPAPAGIADALDTPTVAGMTGLPAATVQALANTLHPPF